MIIGTCGFGSTGSSAVSDYLSEFDTVKVLDRLEFTWVSGVDGLVDLDYHVNCPHSRTSDSIIAINRYRNKVQKSSRLYSISGGIRPEYLKDSVEEFLNSIIQVRWYWDIGRDFNKIERYMQMVARKVIPAIERKVGHQIKCWPMKEVSLSVCPSQFEDAARKHVRQLLVAMGADLSKPIVLDQPFAGNNPQACFKFFEDPYAIVVDRDPRDNYVFANTKLLGGNHFMAVSPVEDFVKYYRAIRENQPYREKNSRIMSIKFEDMVYHYDETTKAIRDFLHLPENPNPKSVFDPMISMPNTQVWKRYPQFAKDIEYIEAELADYLFDYSDCPEPDKNGKMFRGKSPKRK